MGHQERCLNSFRVRSPWWVPTLYSTVIREINNKSTDLEPRYISRIIFHVLYVMCYDIDPLSKTAGNEMKYCYPGLNLCEG